MSELDRLIERIEGSGEEFRFCAEQINPLLVELGGKPICKNISHPGANDGSSLVEIEVYMTLLAVRNLADNDHAMSVMEKKVKVEYVQEESFKEVLKCAIDGEVFYSKGGKGEFRFDVSRMSFVNHDGADMKIAHLTNHEFYRRIETEIDERQEFIKAYGILREKFMIQREYEYFDDFMADSGKFKLVEGE